MSRNAAVVDDDNDIVVVETVHPNPARDLHLPRENVIVLDTSRTRPTRTTTSSIEPIVIDEAPRKRRRRDQSSHSANTTTPVSHPPHVIIVDDSDSPPIRPSRLAFRGRETQTTHVNHLRIHPPAPSSSPFEEDIIEMAVSGPRLAPVRSPPPPPNLGPGNQPFLVEPIVSVTPLSPPHTQRQSLPPLPELISPHRVSLINSSPAPLRAVADTAAPSESIAIQQLELPSIPNALNQNASQPNLTQQYASRLVDIDQILTANPRTSAHAMRTRHADGTRVASALRASISQPVHSHRHPLRYNPSAPRRYVHLERDQTGSLGEVPTPAYVRTSSSRRQHTSPTSRPTRFGAQYEPWFSSFFLPNDAHLSPLQRNHQSDTSQFSPDTNNAPHPLESLARSRYAGVAHMNTAGSNIPASSTPESGRLFSITRSHSRRHAHMSSDVDDLSGLRHIQRRRDLHRTRPSSRRTTTTRPVMRASISSLANAQTATTMYDERVRRQATMRSRARAYARPSFAQSTLHRHSAPHHIAAVVQRMMHQAGGSPGLEIHYLHGFHGDHSLDYEQLIRLDEQLIREKNRADNDQIESLPVHKATAEDKEIRCCICMCDVEEGEELRILPCAHKYHKSCIDEWLTYNGCCPVDKKRIAPSRPRRRCTHHES